MNNPHIINISKITKTFPGVTALNNIDLKISAGSVHCIMGENGAGKSTLVKILTGIYKADSGQIHIDGKNIDADRSAHNLIAYVPQEIDLFPHLTVAENLFMPFHRSNLSKIFVTKQMLEQRAKDILKRFSISVQPNTLVRNISTANQQLLQIARAEAQAGYKILIMDEPTTSLSDIEAKVLFDTVRQMQKDGKSIIFISHKLEEMFAIGDYVSVLRNGRLVGDELVNDIDSDWVVSKMSGEEININELYRPQNPPGNVVLSVSNLSGEQFRNISFSIKAGEILGFAGLIGAGRSELAQSILGYRKLHDGSIQMNGRPFKPSPTKALRSGIIYLPEERKQQGIFASQSIQHNLGISLINATSRLSFILWQKEKKLAEQISTKLQIKMRNLDQKIVFLSGGNQQKVLIGRAIAGKPQLLIFDEPAKGIDIKAKAEIHHQMKHLAEEKQIAIILISSELDEIFKCTNRILTFHAGLLTGEYITEKADRTDIIRGIIGADQ